MAVGVGGIDGGSPRLTSSSLAVLAFHGGGAGALGQAGAGVRAGDTRTARVTVTTARMAMEIPATAMGIAMDLTTAIMEMEILDTDPATAMQANTAPPLDRG